MTTNPELAPDMPKQIWANDSGRKEDGSCNTGTWSAFDTPRAGPYATPSSAPQKYKRTPYIRADLALQAGSVVVGVAALKQEDLNNPYTDRSDNICYWSGWNDCIDDLLKRNFLAGAPVGGDRPAIPGLQEAIERREKLLATKRTLGHENRGIHTEGDPIFEAAKLYAARQSGAPDGYVCVPREPTEAMLDAIADQPYGANAAYEKLIAAAEGK